MPFSFETKTLTMGSRRSFVKQTALAGAALVAANPLSALASVSPSIYGGGFSNKNSISILHTGDLGGQLSCISDGSVYQGLGGFKNIPSVIEALRKEVSNHLFLDAGNMNTELFELAKTLKYDALNLNDFNNNTDYSGLSFISHHPSANTAPFRVIQKGKIRIGIIPANTGSGTSNPVLHALEISTHLKKEENCQLVICLSNLGLDKGKRLNDFSLAKRSEDIDMIIGCGEAAVLRSPKTGFNKNKKEVIINQSAYGGLVVGKVDFQFNENGEKIAVRFNNLLIGTGYHRWKGLPSSDQKVLA